jgi:hypothetical protein
VNYTLKELKMLAWRALVKAAIQALTSQFASIATDLFPTPCLNPHRSKEFRSTLVPIAFAKRSTWCAASGRGAACARENPMIAAIKTNAKQLHPSNWQAICAREERACSA